MNVDIEGISILSKQKISDVLDKYEDGDCELYFNSAVKPLLQKGPQCGIVALAMGLEALGIEKSTCSLQEEAIRLGFTKQGEMFSVKSMAQLSKYGKDLDFPSEEEMSFHLNEGRLFLIPYDCDKNFGAALAGGQKAHWMIACGFISSRNKELIVLGYQGKSRHVMTYNYSFLKASNGQLQEADSNRDSSEYVIEDPTNLSLLRGKCVILAKE